jgi:polysaccharide export outer membrane protein
MNLIVLLPWLVVFAIGGCSWIPRAGPSASEVLEQGQAGGEILFDVVEVNDRVVATLQAQPKERLAVRFKQDAQPPEVKIAIGDTISVLIWESAAGGLFSDSPPALTPSGGRPGVEPLRPEPLRPELRPPASEFTTPPPSPETGRPQEQQRRGVGNPPPGSFSIEATAAAAGRRAAVIPDQKVGADGAISVPYAGRVPAVGRLPEEVQQAIEARLAEKALGPQALVIVKKSEANAVTILVSGSEETSRRDKTGQIVGENRSSESSTPMPGAAAAGAKVPLSVGGERLLQLIAAAGGTKAPVHEIFVRLSRQGVTATVPMEQLVEDPAENIYAQPGDALTLVQVPQTFSVFGATGRNAEIPFDARSITLGDALGKAQGLRDDLAKPEGVFLFRYEPNSVVRALDQPISATSREGVSPVIYRFNLRNGKAYLLAQQFPVHDKDVIFVADAPAAQMYKFFSALSQVTGPIVTGLVTCHYAKC